MTRSFALLLVSWLLLHPACLHAQTPSEPSADTPAQDGLLADEIQQQYHKFAEALSGVKLVGRFTTLGQENELPDPEEYTIYSATKMPDGDYWMLKTRIRYGGLDITVPIPLEVKWAGDTPVITLTKLAIPGLGTFSSRVLFYNDKYAGTWTHGEVGGHLFGTLKELDDQDAKAEP